MLGYNSRSSPPPEGRYTAISVASDSACVVSAAGEISRWGTTLWPDRSSDGVFLVIDGELDTTVRSRSLERPSAGDDSYRQLDVPEDDWVYLSPGGGHTCGLNHAGEIHCWGWNDEGKPPRRSSPAYEQERERPVV